MFYPYIIIALYSDLWFRINDEQVIAIITIFIAIPFKISI